jgi:hypothetical protein
MAPAARIDFTSTRTLLVFGKTMEL